MTWGRLERSVHFGAAYDRRHSDPSQDYGLHGVDMHMALCGPVGATTFTLFTGWQLPHVQAEFKGLTLAPVLEEHPENVSQREAVFRVQVEHGGPHLRLGPSDPRRMGDFTHLSCLPLPADLGYHALVPQNDWHREHGPSQEHCDWLSGRPCYYDGSALNADPVFAHLVAGGDEVVWSRLEAEYWEMFGLAHHLVEACLWLDSQLERRLHP